VRPRAADASVSARRDFSARQKAAATPHARTRARAEQQMIVIRNSTVPGAGLGAFATSDVRAGDLIVASETPIAFAMRDAAHGRGIHITWCAVARVLTAGVAVPSPFATHTGCVSGAAGGAAGAAAFDALFAPPSGGWSPDQEDRAVAPAIARVHEIPEADVLRAYARYVRNHFTSTFVTAALRVVDATAVFAQASRINHSCRPNAEFRMVLDGDGALRGSVTALRGIAAGEEIFVKYAEHADLPAAHGFACTQCADAGAPAKPRTPAKSRTPPKPRTPAKSRAKPRARSRTPLKPRAKPCTPAKPRTPAKSRAR
jgi:hypothetical protein